MNPRALFQMGIPKGNAMSLAIAASARAAQEGLHREKIRSNLREVVSNPAAWRADPTFGAPGRCAGGVGGSPGPRSAPAPCQRPTASGAPTWTRQPWIRWRRPAGFPWPWREPSCRTPTWATACPSAACWPPREPSSPTPSASTSRAA